MEALASLTQRQPLRDYWSSGQLRLFKEANQIFIFSYNIDLRMYDWIGRINGGKEWVGCFFIITYQHKGPTNGRE